MRLRESNSSHATSTLAVSSTCTPSAASSAHGSSSATLRYGKLRWRGDGAGWVRGR